MIKETGSSRLDSNLAKAQELALRGKRQQALDELWRAEALARGDANSLRQMSDFVTSLQGRLEPQHSTGFPDLVDVLQHDIESVSRRRTSASATPRTSLAASLGIGLLWIMGGGLVGAVIGGIVGRATENPNEMFASLDPVVGAIIGFPIGALLGLVLCAGWRRW